MALLPQPGEIIAGKYAVVRVLGEGGMGIVFEATHQRLRQPVAVKMLLPAMLKHEVVVERFDREARAAAQLKGSHVARVTDVDVTTDGLPYMVMEFLVGHDLEVEITQRGRLPVPEAADYVLQACAAMVEAHQLGIIHRDLKPSNLFLTHNADGRILKVLDFGISKFVADEDAKLTEINAVMGTAMYMSPEQVRASHAVDARADIWALGVILYEALSGRAPFLGSPAQVAAMIVIDDPPDLQAIVPELPDTIIAIVERALERDPALRFGDVRELAATLAPHAPKGSIGRTFADALGLPPSPVKRRSQRAIPIPAGNVDAASSGSMAQPKDTIVEPPPSLVIESSPGSVLERKAIHRSLALGMAVALLVIGAFGIAMALRGKPAAATAARPDPVATVAATASASAVASAAAPTPAPQESATAANSSATAHPAAPSHGSTKAKSPTNPPPGPPPPAPKPSPATTAADKPLFL